MDDITVIKKDFKIDIPVEYLQDLDMTDSNLLFFECVDNKLIIKKL